jgi:hypothetical protein
MAVKPQHLCFWRSPSHGAQPLGLACFTPEFTPGRAGPPSPPPAPKNCTVTQTYKSGSPAVSGGGEGQGVVLLGAPRNENLESWDSGPGQIHAANFQVWNLAGRPSKTFCRGIQVLVTRGAVSSAVERSDSMFGSWRKLPDGAQSTSPEHCLMASDNFLESGCKVRGRRKTWTESSLLHASTRLGARISTIQVASDFKFYV